MADILLILVVMTNLRLLATSRIPGMIMWVAIQGVLLGLFPLLSKGVDMSFSVILVAVVAISLKGYVFPKLLFRALRDVPSNREVEPYVSYITSLLFGLLVLTGSLWLSARLPFPGASLSRFVLPATLFSLFAGVFLIVGRKKAVTQVVGYLVMENGLFMLSVGCIKYTPLLLEIAVFLDLFVAVFLMGIMIQNMHRAFSHIDTHELRRLRG